MKTLAMLFVLGQAAIAVLGNEIEGAEPADSGPAKFSTGKLAVWPDLARVDLVLDRQPFQHAASLKGVQWADGGRTLITSSNGFLVSADGGRSLRISRNGFFAWDVESQQMLRQFSPQLTMSQMIAMSPDGTKLATIGYNNQPRIYDWPSLEVLFAGPKSGDVRPQALVFSPDGKFLAVGFNTRRGNKSIVRVFNCANFEQEYGRYDRRIEALAWAPDSSYLVVAETRGTVIFLSPEGELIRRGIRLEPAESPVGLAVSADGKLLAICTRRSIGVYTVLGRQKLWYDTPEEQSDRSLLQPIRPCFSADSSELFNLGWKQNDDSTFLVARDAETGKPLRELQAGNSSNNLLELSPDSKSLVFIGRNNSLEICDSATFKSIATSDSNWPYTNVSRLRDTPVGMRVSPDGRRLLRFGWQHLAMWNLETGERMWTVKRPDHVRGAAWNSKSKWIATIRDGNQDEMLEAAVVEIYDPATGRLVRGMTLDDPSAIAGPVAVLSSNRIVACDAKNVYLFGPTGRRIWKQKLCDKSARLCDIAVNQDETVLAVVKRLPDGNRLPGNRFSSGTVLLLDATTGEVKRELSSLITPATVTFSRDGKRVVASTARRNRNRGHIYPILEQWSVETGRRENIAQVPDDQAKGEDFFQGSDEEVLKLVTDCPLVCSHRVRTNGAMGVSPDRRLLLVEKPIEYGESDSTGRLRVSARYMLWDIDEQKPIATWLIPHRIHDAAILPDGRVATLNQNGTIYVMRRE